MQVIYDGEMWSLKTAVRGSLFLEWKLSNPDLEVTITKEGREKKVKLGELIDYSIYRNTTKIYRQ